MDLIFLDQIQHQRDIISTIDRARRRWKRLYHWFPKEQRRLYSEMERIYKENTDAHADVIKEYSKERRLNKRVLKIKDERSRDKEDFKQFPSLKKILDKFDHIPMLYYYENCGSPGYCQQAKNAAM